MNEKELNQWLEEFDEEHNPNGGIWAERFAIAAKDALHERELRTNEVEYLLHLTIETAFSYMQVLRNRVLEHRVSSLEKELGHLRRRECQSS
jgi:hypothetical protein